MISVPSVSNPWWLKVGLIAGFAMFASAAMFLVWMIPSQSGWLPRLISVGVALPFLWIAFKGLQLLKFLSYSLSISNGVVTIRSRRGDQVFPMGELTIHVSEGWQIIHVHDAAGRKVYAADFRATNAGHLVRYVESSERLERIRRNREKPRITKAQLSARLAEVERHDRRQNFVFAAFLIGLVVAYLAVVSGFSNTHGRIFIALVAILLLYAFGSTISVFWGGGNTAKRFGVICGSCDGGLVGWAGQHAMATGICPHCRLRPFDP